MSLGNFEISQPGGDALKNLDTSRSDILELFGEKGRTLFNFLLASAHPLPDYTQVAVHSGRLCDIASELRWSPDTVKRYMAVFRACGLVHHFHDRRQSQAIYHLPLGPFVPLTNFALLDEIIHMTRKKQRQLAMHIKERYIERFGDPTLSHSPHVYSGLEALRAILEEEHLEPLKRQRLQRKLADLLTQLMITEPGVEDLNHVSEKEEPLPPSGSTPEAEDLKSKREDPPCQQGASLEEDPGKVGDMKEQPGNLKLPLPFTAVERFEQQGDGIKKWGDLRAAGQARSDRAHERQEDRKQSEGDQSLMLKEHSSSEAAKQGVLKQSEGDPAWQKSASSAQKEGDPGDIKQQVPLREGDLFSNSAGNVLAAAPSTYNVNYIIKNITGNNVMRKQLAQFLANVLEKQEVENGYPTFTKYLKAFQVYSPEVIGRAFLATMVLLHRRHWQVERAGALFTTQCKILIGEKPASQYTFADVEEWLRLWGDLPYSALIDVLAVLPPTEVSPAPLVAAWKQSSHTTVKAGHAGWDQVGTRKRTHGMFYTGRLTPRKGFNTTGSPYPPQSEQQ